MNQVPQSTFQAKPAMNKNWNESLNKDKAGQANNAEDFTKQFMSQMYGGQSQQNQQQQSNMQQNNRMQTNCTPIRQPAPQQQNWNETLNKDKAGTATSAEDFTKQFMGQMYGGQPHQTSQQQQQMNRTHQQSTFQQKTGQVLIDLKLNQCKYYIYLFRVQTPILQVHPRDRMMLLTLLLDRRKVCVFVLSFS